MQTNIWKPLTYFVAILVIIFVCETAVMFLLPCILPSDADSTLEAIVDSTMLTILSAPVLWILLIRPLRDAARNVSTWFMAVIDQSQDGILTLSESGSVETANLASVQLLGVTLSGLLNRKLGDTVPALAQHPLILNLSSMAPGSIGNQTGEANLPSEDDGDRFVEIVISKLCVGSRNRYAMVIRDVTQRKIAEKTIAEANRRVIDAAHQAGKAEIATCVIHNVGNVLTNVNVLATAASNRVRHSKLSGLSKAADLIRGHQSDLANYLTNDDRGRKIPAYILELSGNLERESTDLLSNLTDLIENLDHANKIVSAQQDFAGFQAGYEWISLRELMEQALAITIAGLERHSIEIATEVAELPPAYVDRQKLVQVLVNLLKNAKEAFNDRPLHDRRIVLRVQSINDDRFVIDIIDNGVGIDSSIMSKIFSSGFTTKPDGHGIGLHYSSLAVKQMGGELTCQSHGFGQGTTFTLDMPMQHRDQEAP